METSHVDDSTLMWPGTLPPLPVRVLQSIVNRSSKITGFRAKYLEPLGFRGSAKPHLMGMSVLDPFGLGPISRTLRVISGRENVSTIQFRETLEWMHKAYPGVPIVVGGPGSWQLDAADMATLGLDYLFKGEAEYSFPEFLLGFSESRVLGMSVVEGRSCRKEDIPPTEEAAAYGMIEVTRGCGRSCSFCYSAQAGPVRSLPQETIIESAKNTLSKGTVETITLQSDDLMLYGTEDGARPGEALVSLLRSIREAVGDAAHIMPLHFTPSSLVAAKESASRALDLLSLEDRSGLLVTQIGLETGSPKLVRKYMDRKPAPFSAEDWPDVCRQALELLSGKGIFTIGTLVVGFPGESDADILDTIELVDSLAGYPMTIVPVLFARQARLGRNEDEDLMRTQHHLLEQEHYGTLFSSIRENNAKWQNLRETGPIAGPHDVSSIQELALVWDALLRNGA